MQQSDSGSLHRMILPVMVLYSLTVSSCKRLESFCGSLPVLGQDLYEAFINTSSMSLPLSDSSLEFTSAQNITGTNCTFQRSPGAYTVSGSRCTQIPGNHSVQETNLYVQQIPMTTIRSKSFLSWEHLEALHVTRNPVLKTIETDAFLSLIRLVNLTVTSNSQLQYFNEGCFRGLIALRQLSLIGNRILKISQISHALTRIDLPKLNYIDLRENFIPVIAQHEFVSMANSSLESLILSSTQTEYIDEKAFDPLVNLKKIIFTLNKINGSVAGALINSLKKLDTKLDRVSLAANPLYNDQDPLLQAVADSNITFLDISNTYFLDLEPGFFPPMPNLQKIDLSNILIYSLPENVINSTIMPRLTDLYLSKNNLKRMTTSFALPTLEKLDLSYINFNNLAWNMNFKIEPAAFKKMPNLRWISFAGTRLFSLSRHIFEGGVNLEYLSLRETSLCSIDDGSFRYNGRLKVLDISHNNFAIFKPISKNLFTGLSGLRALDLSYCHISSFPEDDVFQHLTSLQYLALGMNSLYRIDSSVFDSLNCLISVDLRYNTMVSWNEPLFRGKTYLRDVSLDYNHLTTLSGEMLNDFSYTSSVNLKGNSIVCDCDLVNAVLQYATLNETDSFYSLPFNKSSDVCSNPPYQMIASYLTSAAYSYECQAVKWPVVLAIVLIILIFLIFLVYFVYRNYKLSIEFAYLTLKERMGLIKFRGRNVALEKLDGTVKDAFVSYSSEDESFVEKMVYILESEGFDLLLYKRDFNVGDIIPDKILESIESSRKTILVLSESFAKSEWCLWEMYIAQNRSIALIKSEREPLLLIKKSQIDESIMTPTLKHLLKTRVYLQWHDSPFRQTIFWHQLKLALKPSKKEINAKEIPT